jgi:hypothetical protein
MNSKMLIVQLSHAAEESDLTLDKSSYLYSHQQFGRFCRDLLHVVMIVLCKQHSLTWKTAFADKRLIEHPDFPDTLALARVWGGSPNHKGVPLAAIRWLVGVVPGFEVSQHRAKAQRVLSIDGEAVMVECGDREVLLPMRCFARRGADGPNGSTLGVQRHCKECALIGGRHRRQMKRAPDGLHPHTNGSAVRVHCLP